MSSTLLHVVVFSFLLQSGFTRSTVAAPEPFKEGDAAGSGTEATPTTPTSTDPSKRPEIEVAPRPGQILAAAKAVEEQAQDKAAATKPCKFLITVTDDFIVAAYKNGEAIPLEKRNLLLDRFGATAEKINVEVQSGDWLVFQVVHNPVRWGGTKYFAVAGCYAANEFAFVSDPTSKEWSVCDDPAQAAGFIKQRKIGADARTSVIENPWAEGDGLMKQHAGESFAGKALWGKTSACWIKYLAPRGEGEIVDKKPRKTGVDVVKVESGAESDAALVEPKRWPVQIVSAIYGTAGKNADVTAKVKEYVEKRRVRFASNPKDLGADPNPYWNKGLHIIYLKDGVRREQHRNENEHILPESFYGPQDAGELRVWLPETRWSGPGGEVQFHSDGTFTLLGSEKRHRWEAVSAKSLKLTWAEKEPVQFNFDYTWESFSEVENGKNVFHVVR